MGQVDNRLDTEFRQFLRRWAPKIGLMILLATFSLAFGAWLAQKIGDLPAAIFVAGACLAAGVTTVMYIFGKK